jgi:hypothetical protein
MELIDPNLGSAVIYAAISCVYLRRSHGPGCRVILALAALLLGLCAALKSGPVHDWNHSRALAAPVSAECIGAAGV